MSSTQVSSTGGVITGGYRIAVSILHVLINNYTFNLFVCSSSSNNKRLLQSLTSELLSPEGHFVR